MSASTEPDATPVSRPAVTRAQIIATLTAGVPVISNLLAAFGVWHPNPHQQHALTETLTWAVVFAALLVAGDAHLRGKRNEASASEPKLLRLHEAPTFGRVAGGPPAHDAEHADTAARLSDTLGKLSDSDPRDNEIDLGRPDLDDPEFGDQASGITRESLEAHAGLATQAEIDERDARLAAAAPRPMGAPAPAPAAAPEVTS